jgi:hypothetical protein
VTALQFEVTNVCDETTEKVQHICHLSLNMEFENIYNADGFDLIWTLAKCNHKEHIFTVRRITLLLTNLACCGS